MNSDTPGLRAILHVCPECGAEPGDECLTRTGKKVPGWLLRDGGETIRYPGTHATRVHQ